MRSAPDVKVYARAAEAQTGWASNWDVSSGSVRVTVEYGSDFVPPVEYEKVTGGSVSENIGLYYDNPEIENSYWVVKEAQPYQTIDCEYNIVIPATRIDPDTGAELPVGKIESAAFSYTNIHNLTIEYSDMPIQIESEAFSGIEDGISITVNRDVIFGNGQAGQPIESKSENVFGFCDVKTIILPDTVDEIGNTMFASCKAENILFVTPSGQDQYVTNGTTGITL